MSKLPEIRFKSSWLLAPIIKSYVEAQEWDILPDEDLKNSIEEVAKTWTTSGEQILKGICEITGLEFYSNIIDVYLALGYKGGISDPLVISSQVRDKKFLSLLTHEILHRLLTDNTKKIDVGTIWEKMFPDVSSRKVRNHIVLHAIHKELLLSVLNDEEELKRIIAFDQKFEPYKKAWDIVEEKGHKVIIDKFKSFYINN
ncbi:hypothetical protein HN375_02075 [bacterium]|jgi:hypothetical protein|nr:hypothetical protein [bacterium]MBT6049613.1 hypothetical protein [Candidatus Scalindua sp.]